MSTIFFVRHGEYSPGLTGHFETLTNNGSTLVEEFGNKLYEQLSGKRIDIIHCFSAKKPRFQETINSLYNVIGKGDPNIVIKEGFDYKDLPENVVDDFNFWHDRRKDLDFLMNWLSFYFSPEEIKNFTSPKDMINEVGSLLLNCDSDDNCEIGLACLKSYIFGAFRAGITKYIEGDTKYDEFVSNFDKWVGNEELGLGTIEISCDEKGSKIYKVIDNFGDLKFTIDQLKSFIYLVNNDDDLEFFETWTSKNLNSISK